MRSPTNIMDIMNNIKNHVQLICYIGQDAESKQIANGNMLAKVSLATNEVYKNKKGEKVTNTDWHRLTAWGKTAELMMQFCKKGKEVAIIGKINYNSYLDKEEKMRYVTNIIVKEILVLSKKENSNIIVQE